MRAVVELMTRLSARAYRANRKTWEKKPFMRSPSRSLILWAIILASQTTWRSPSAVADDNHSAQVDAMFAEWDRPDSPGFAVGIIRCGKWLHKRGYGAANLDEGIRITPETMFDLFSVAKSFTTASAVAVCSTRAWFLWTTTFVSSSRNYRSSIRP